MISISLPPVFFGGGNVATGEVFEAFAMAYWSQYNTEAVQARVLECHKRAWGVDSVYLFPRDPDTHPGALVARIGTPDNYRTVVAIEGMASIRQIVGTHGALDPVAITNIRGHVVKAFKDAAFLVWAELIANPLVAADLLAPGRIVTFTGHSQGAAIADILASYCKSIVRGKTIHLVKFASPRVGTERYREARNPAIKVKSIWTERDLLISIPSGNLTFWQPSGNPFRPLTALALYKADYGRVLNTYGSEDYHAERGVQDLNVASALRFFTHTPSPDNPWYTHTPDYYRLCLTAWAMREPDDFGFRLKYLEHNDDNRFQRLWFPGLASVPDHGLDDPAPEAVRAPNGYVAALADEQAPPTPAAQHFDPIHDGGDTMGGDWGNTEPPTITWINPQRRTRRVQVR